MTTYYTPANQVMARARDANIHRNATEQKRIIPEGYRLIVKRMVLEREIVVDITNPQDFDDFYTAKDTGSSWRLSAACLISNADLEALGNKVPERIERTRVEASGDTNISSAVYLNIPSDIVNRLQTIEYLLNLGDENWTLVDNGSNFSKTPISSSLLKVALPLMQEAAMHLRFSKDSVGCLEKNEKAILDSNGNSQLIVDNEARPSLKEYISKVLKGLESWPPAPPSPTIVDPEIITPTQVREV